MSAKLTMTELYNKLEKLGFSKEFIRAIGLPSWWVDELDLSTNLDTIYEAASYISRRLFINLKSLIDVTQEAKFVNNMTYKEVLDVLEFNKHYLLQHPEILEDVSTYSEDNLDYFEQLLEVEL